MQRRSTEEARWKEEDQFREKIRELVAAEEKDARVQRLVIKLFSIFD